MKTFNKFQNKPYTHEYGKILHGIRNQLESGLEMKAPLDEVLKSDSSR